MISLNKMFVFTIKAPLALVSTLNYTADKPCHEPVVMWYTRAWNGKYIIQWMKMHSLENLKMREPTYKWIKPTLALIRMPMQMSCPIICNLWDNQDVLQLVNTTCKSRNTLNSFFNILSIRFWIFEEQMFFHIKPFYIYIYTTYMWFSKISWW